MLRRTLISLTIGAGAAAALALPGFAGTEPAYRVSDPIVHDNLAIYFVHGKSQPGPVPLTLAEAVGQGRVKVYETGDVRNLSIENLGDEPVFVQSGDVVRGGRQDRVLTTSLIVPPKSGRVSIGAFCVEHGRWTARGAENDKLFMSAASAIPSLRAKLAMKAPRATVAAPARSVVQGILNPREDEQGVLSGDASSTRQSAVWASVAATQDKLSRSVGGRVESTQSPSSLQLALEHKEVIQASRTYVAKLKPAGTAHDDIVGFVFAINGKINSADIYPSNGLFRKMWVKLLTASATEATGERKGDATPKTLPDKTQVLAFLTAAESGTAERRKLIENVRLETRTGKDVYLFETSALDGDWIHRNYLAK